jgi:hypothetical protein
VRYALLLLALLSACPALTGAPRDPYDYAARQRLVTSARRTGDFPSALYHAAWLAWLAPRKYAGPAQSILEDRRLVDPARRAVQGDPVAAVLAALDAHRARREVWLSGHVPSQSPLRQERIAALAAQGEAIQARLNGPDPVVRLALADLYLTLDDVITFSTDPTRVKERGRVLRQAVAAAGSVTEGLPAAPGAYRTLALARARLADLDNDPEEWDLAVTACAHALALDPDDQALCELMWSLHLRAGHWEEAERWQRRCDEEVKEQR